ncbi:trypsin-like peptidase domain-containing protein [Streptomyces sp. NPDC088551]|uniref:trypsin-like peptidase domain-containing protein n=1 Tax=Streptomyces sp. NPDC088551 TaxID=3365863 RepID=UPI003829F573
MTGGVGLRIERVAQIIVEAPEAGAGGETSGPSRGSGYLVAAATVLTAAHVVSRGARVRVWFLSDEPGGREFTATVTWRHDGIDVAVLTLVAPDRARIEVAPTPLGRVGEHDRSLPCSAVGFPLYKFRDDAAAMYREAAHLHDATCAPLSNSRGGTLELTVPTPPAGLGPAQSPWEGMSGAAVFSGARIVGVIGKHHHREGPGRLDAGHVGRWAGLLTRREGGDRSGDEDGEALLRRLESLLRQGLRPADLPDMVLRAAGSPRLPRGVRHHAQMVARGAYGKKYLTKEHLRFVRPRDGRHPTDPSRLWARLSGSHPEAVRGVMLVGAAGTGKSRTCFEVADLAEQAGWHVLHVTARAGVSAEDLVDVVRGVPGENVLFVFDYFDTYAELNLTHLAAELEDLDVSGAPGTRVACVASVRPGALPAVGRQNPDWRRVFSRPEEMCQDADHQQAVAELILDRVARDAVGRFGRPSVAALCGRRSVPAVVLMRGQEIESAVRAGATLRHLQSRAGRDEYAPLTLWTRQRTGEDLATLSGAAEVTRLASAVAAAACPQDRRAVKKAVQYLLDHHDGPDPGTGAEGVVEGLFDRGWLVPSGGQPGEPGEPGEIDETAEINVMHDVVADEYLYQVCFQEGWFRADTVKELLSAFLVSTRTLRLAAGHVRRWVTDLDERRRAKLQPVCDGWLHAHAAALGERLTATAELAEGGATLLTLLTGAPWQSGAVAEWDRLIAPWLRVAEAEAPALVRHLFAAALRNTADAVPEPLAAAVVTWLRRNRDAPDAHSVVESLAQAGGLPDPWRADAVAAAVEWLTTHGVAPRRRPAFAALLSRRDLTPDVRERVLDLGMAGVRQYVPAASAAHVLRTLLSRPDLDDDRLHQVIRLAHRWLVAHPREPEASFVLRSLLTRTDLDAHWLARTVERALAWIGAQGADPVASYVLRRVLTHPGLTAGVAARAADRALRWLQDNVTRSEASFVLPQLLSLRGPERGPEPAWTAGAVDYALRWLDHDDHGTSEQAVYVLRSLLDQVSLPPETAESVSEWALAWLGVHGESEDARSVLPGLLGLPSTAPHSQELLAGAFALDWLEDYHTTPEASFVLRPLLDHPMVRGERVEDVARYALAWLDRHATAGSPSLAVSDTAPDAVSFVLKSLLTKRDLSAEGIRTATDIALAWLGPRHTDEGARFVLGAVLPHAGGPGDDRAVTFAMEWLAQDHGTAVPAAYVLGPLLTRGDPDPERAGRAVDHAARWLRTHHAAREADLVVWPLLSRPGLDAGQSRLAAEVALRLVAVRPGELTKRRLLWLCQLGPLPGGSGAAIADHVLDRMEDGSTGSTLLPSALRRHDIRPDQVERLADRALELCEVNPTSARRGVVLRALLGRTDLDAGRAGQAAARTRAWLAVRGGSVFAGRLLEPLLARPDSDAEGDAPGPPGPEEGDSPGPTAVSLALGWLDANATHDYAGDVLLAALNRPGLTPGQAEAFATYARTWIAAADPADDRVSRLSPPPPC